jgi:hypothetical protein
MTANAEAIRKHEARASKALLAAVSVTKANTELALAMLNAESASLPSHVVDALGDAIEILERVVKDTEQFRLRQLRKADHKESAHV